MIAIISTYGTSVHTREGAFLVKNKDGERKLAPSKVRAIVLHQGTSITTHAAILAVNHQIDVIFAFRDGQPAGRIWSHRFGSISDIRIKQLAWVQSPAANNMIRQMLVEKCDRQISLLKSLAHDRPSLSDIVVKATESLAEAKQAMENTASETFTRKETHGRLRGLEGSAARAYFQCLGQIVPEPYRFEKRSKRPARDMFNCILNYLYGILYARVESALITAGIDPYLGIMHRNEYNRPVLVFDLIEQYRIWADAVTLHLCFRHIPDESMFTFRNNGYWLEGPGKKLVVQAFNLYMEEIEQWHGRRRSRYTHIQDDSHALAGTITGKKNEPDQVVI